MSFHPSYATHLCAWYSKGEQDLVYGGPNQYDPRLLHAVLATERMHADTSTPGWTGHVFDPSFVDELKRRGYDITTLKFSVKRARKSEPSHDGTAIEQGACADPRPLERKTT